MTLDEFKEAVTRLEEALLEPKSDFLRDSIVRRIGYCMDMARKAAGPDLMIEADKDPSVIVGQLQGLLTQSIFPYKVDLVEFRLFSEAYKAGYLRDRQRLFG